MSTAAPQARLARTVAEALIRFADELEAADVDIDVRSADETAAPEAEHILGKRQRQIVDLPGLADDAGLRTAEIAAEIDYQVPNTYTTLQALARSGIVELVPQKEPQHWRLARRYRPNAATFMRMAGLLEPGEWTTYGDISIAVLGDNRAARGVGRAAAKVDGFPNPHRVLMQGGRINPDWTSSDGLGPEECRRRLRDEGVELDDDGAADPARRVDWHELRRRDAGRAAD